MKHFVSPGLFDHFVERYKNTNVNSIDPRFVKLIHRLNRLDGIVTLFSCSGHTADEIEERCRTFGKAPDRGEYVQQPHIVFVVKDETGMKVVDDFVEWMDTHADVAFKKYRATLTLMRLRWGGIFLTDILKKDDTYPAFKISFNLDAKSNSYGDDPVDDFDVVIKNMIEYMEWRQDMRRHPMKYWEELRGEEVDGQA